MNIYVALDVLETSLISDFISKSLDKCIQDVFRYYENDRTLYSDTDLYKITDTLEDFNNLLYQLTGRTSEAIETIIADIEESINYSSEL